jgi:hypothetical protein
MNKESLSSPTWILLAIANPCIIMFINFHVHYHKSFAFQLIQLHFGGGGLLDKDGSFFFYTKTIIGEITVFHALFKDIIFFIVDLNLHLSSKKGFLNF